MGQGRYRGDSEAIWAQLTGKRMVLAGNSGRLKESFRQSLTYKSSEMGEVFAVTDDLENAGAGDYVFFFSAPGESGEENCGNTAASVGAAAGTGKTPVSAGASQKRRERELELLEQLKTLAQKPVASAVLVSDNCVYGKLFGEAHALAEHELGYVCHTSPGDQDAAGLRVVENLAYRLAEEGAPIRIVRMDTRCTGIAEEQAAGRNQTVPAGNACGNSDMTSILEAAVRVLLCGAPGEVYNLPTQPNREAVTEHSPLSPFYIVTDVSKLEQLANKTEDL